MRPPVSMTIASLALLAVLSPSAGLAQQRCADVESAKLALNAKPATRNPMAARAQDVQAPRQQGDVQAPRSQDVQAPRNQDIQAPRGQDVQAPRSQDIQAPRSQDMEAPRSQEIQAPRSQDVQAPRNQDVQAPRSQDIQAPRSGQSTAPSAGTAPHHAQAAQLVKEAEAACSSGNTAVASEKARAAMSLIER